jgi:hypothetical protein
MYSSVAAEVVCVIERDMIAREDDQAQHRRSRGHLPSRVWQTDGENLFFR